MNQSIVKTSIHALAAAVLAITTSAYAQAPAGVLERPTNQTNPAGSSGVPGDKAQMRVDDKTGSMPGVAPAGTLPPTTRPANQSNPIAATGVPGDKAQMKVDDRKASVAAGMQMNRAERMAAMDANSDGKISRREYNNYHNMRWGQMKSSNGMVMSADMDAMMHGGPN